jgi:SulP family sulfate permease
MQSQNPYRFNRLELAGSFGDLGTLLPLAIGMILVNGLDASGLFFTAGLYYILSGLYFGITVPVQPMKVIGAYAIAAGLSPASITAAGLWLGALMLLIGGTGIMSWIGRYTPRAVVRGVQVSTGILLMDQGIRFMIGTSKFQQAAGAVEPYLTLQSIGPMPIGIFVGVIGGLLTLLLLDNKRLPAGLLVVLGGLVLGGLLGSGEGFDRLNPGLHLPSIFPFGFPTAADFSLALLVLVLPQIPMTLGNAVIAYADLSREYFGDGARKITYRSACVSIGLANILSVLFGGMPLCHGAGGLAAHYRFGARTAGSNLMVGALFVLMAVLFGSGLLGFLYLLPMAILGVLLVFAGGQLALTVIDVNTRKDLFVALLMVGITLASNLAAGFIVGIAVAYLLKSDRLSV